MSGAEALVRNLEAAGVEYVFGMSGHANLAILDALAGSKIEFISVPHEQLAVHQADCYYRASHKVGVVLTTLGPGLGNAIAGLIDAAQDGSAVMLLVGNVPTPHSGNSAYQEVSIHSDGSQIDLVRPLVKRAWRISHPKQLVPALGRAFNYALGPPAGPVAIDLPMDVMTIVDDFELPSFTRAPTSGRAAGNPKEIAKTVSLLEQAQRPLLFSGGGVLQAEATDELVSLAELISAPVVTTLAAQGAVSNEHALFGGVVGAVGTPTANYLVANADVVVAVGTQMSDIDCNSHDPRFFFSPPDVHVIQIDVDPAQIGRVIPVDVGLHADAKVALAQLIEEINRNRVSHPSQRVDWINLLKQAKRRWQDEISASQESKESPLLPERILRVLRAYLPDEGCIVTGIGPRYFVAQHFPLKRPGTHFVASGNGTMGFAVPGALGVKLGRPDVPVICVCGDGEMKSTSQSLAVAAEYDIPVMWIVLNNYSYNVIELYQSRYYEGRFLGSVFQTREGRLYSPDYAALAHAYGIQGQTVSQEEELVAAVEEGFKKLDEGSSYLLQVDVSRRPKLRASGFWEANRYLVRGWNIDAKTEIGGFGDAEGQEGWRGRPL